VSGQARAGEGVAQLREALRRLGAGELRRASPVRGGRHTQVLRLECESGTYGLRVFPPGQEELARREYLVMRHLQGTRIPAPEPHALLTLEGRAAILMSWCPGRPMATELMRRPWRACHLGASMGRLQAELHSLDVPPELRSALPSWLEAIPLDPELRCLLERASLGRESLLHLDVHPFNVMTDGGRVTGLLDWANARLGDPRADWARTLSILQLDVGPRPWIVVALVRLFELGWRWGYRSRRGRLAHMPAFLAWAGELLLRDRGPRPDRQDSLSPAQVARVRRWISTWRRRAGL